jgi:hypothetical protein
MVSVGRGRKFEGTLEDAQPVAMKLEIANDLRFRSETV